MKDVSYKELFDSKSSRELTSREFTFEERCSGVPITYTQLCSKEGIEEAIEAAKLKWDEQDKKWQETKSHLDEMLTFLNKGVK